MGIGTWAVVCGYVCDTQGPRAHVGYTHDTQPLTDRHTQTHTQTYTHTHAAVYSSSCVHGVCMNVSTLERRGNCPLCVFVCVCVCVCRERERERERESCLLVFLAGSVRGRCQRLLFTYVCRAYEGIYLCTAGRVVDCYLITCFPVTTHQRLWFLVCASDKRGNPPISMSILFVIFEPIAHKHTFTQSHRHTHTHTHTRICALYNYASRIEAHSPQTHKDTHTRRCDSLTPSLTYSHIHYTPTCLPSRHNSSCFACLFHKMKNEKMFSLCHCCHPLPPLADTKLQVAL